jgi:hypothetical protein
MGLRLLTTYIPFASDWEVYFQPTILGWLEGSQALYEDRIGTGGVWNFPWLVWPLIPLAVWPAWLGWGLLVVVTLLAMVWLTRNYKWRWLVFTSPLIGDLVINGQVDVFPMLGIGLGWLAGDRTHLLGLALVLMSTKPQACFLVALWLLLRHRHRLQVLLVPIAVFVLSLAIHSWDWPLRWASGPPVFGLMANVNNCTPWASIGLWMAPVALALGVAVTPHTAQSGSPGRSQCADRSLPVQPQPGPGANLQSTAAGTCLGTCGLGRVLHRIPQGLAWQASHAPGLCHCRRADDRLPVACPAWSARHAE